MDILGSNDRRSWAAKKATILPRLERTRFVSLSAARQQQSVRVGSEPLIETSKKRTGRVSPRGCPLIDLFAVRRRAGLGGQCESTHQVDCPRRVSSRPKIEPVSVGSRTLELKDQKLLITRAERKNGPDAQWPIRLRILL